MIRAGALGALGALIWCAASAQAAKAAEDPSLRERIAAQLGDHHAGFASAVRDPASVLTPIEAPLFRRTRFFRVEKRLPTRPVLFYVAVPQAGDPALLSGAPAAFDAVVARDPARVRTAADAVALARLYYETTRDTGERHLLVESIDDVPYRTDLTGADARLRDQSRAELTPRLRPLAATRAAGGGFRVTGHAVADTRLVELDAAITRTGHVTLSEKPLRDDLPLTYAN
jgi:hypothetical protein